MCIGHEQSELDILLFKEVLDHISRVDRVLAQPGGLLLMGDLVVLAERLQCQLLYNPNVSQNYGVKQFKNDLKNVCVCINMLIRILPHSTFIQILDSPNT